MNINEIFPGEELESAIAEGWVRKQIDGTGLAIYNYTNKTQIFHVWNRVTSACRGLIVEESTGKVIARPWDKFFNYSEGDEKHLVHGELSNYVLMDKMDGSLGILYFRNGEYRIATRGSFNSEQAIRATKMFREKYLDERSSEEWQHIMQDFTFMFEIIYPENQIVVNYEDREELVLLGARFINEQNHTSHPVASSTAAEILGWHHSIANVYQPNDLKEFLEENPFDNSEGYVILTEDGYMGKIKHQEYVDLHKVVFEFSEKSAWSLLSQGNVVDISYMNSIRKNDVQRVIDLVASLYENASTACDAYYAEILNSLPADFERKEFALKAREFEYPSVLFTMLDGGNVENAIWRAVKKHLK